MHAGCRALPHRSGGGVAAGRSAATVALLASTRALQRGGAAASACSVRSSLSAASTPAGTSCSSYYTAAQPAWRRQIGSTNSGSAAARSVRAFSTASPTPPPPHAAPPPGGGIAWLHDIGFSANFGRSGDGGDGSSSSMSSSSSNSSDDEDNVNNNAAAGAAADAMPVSNGDGSGPAAAAGGSPQLAAAVERLRAARLDAVVMLAGGLLPGGGLPEWVSRRLDAAYDVHLLQRRACPVLLLGGGTPHKPPVLDARGHVVHEATACADYLIARGARAGDLLKEVSSYDTVGCAAMVAACCMLHAACCMLHAACCMLLTACCTLLSGLPLSPLFLHCRCPKLTQRQHKHKHQPPPHPHHHSNAYFALAIHAIPAGWRRVAVATSAFHMARSKALFEDIWRLAGAQLHGDPDWCALRGVWWVVGSCSGVGVHRNFLVAQKAEASPSTPFRASHTQTNYSPPPPRPPSFLIAGLSSPLSPAATPASLTPTSTRRASRRKHKRSPTGARRPQASGASPTSIRGSTPTTSATRCRSSSCSACGRSRTTGCSRRTD